MVEHSPHILASEEKATNIVANSLTRPVFCVNLRVNVRWKSS